ncbi:MAG TPA: YedE-related selenium metabolism membrane protein, partial [Armatimonadetes bacterium]|nr:YedE-related selenium metabolism membrane protein [Armatimonadota bacterium]
MVVVTGLTVGIAGAILVKFGNPGNMGVCVACFLRDMTGALGLHSADKVQYLRPEIIGFALGACISALLFGEFKPRGGSSPLIRFLLGAFFMIGALIFLGCPLRMILRLGGGDLNAIAGLLGWVSGIYIGVIFLRSGFTLGRAFEVRATNSWVLPGFMVLALLLMLFLPSLLRFSIEGPGAMHAPLFVSLFIGMLIGALAQRSRLCFTAGFRDMILIRDPHLLMGIIAVFIGVLIANIALGQFHLGIANQPVAHSAQLWN